MNNILIRGCPGTGKTYLARAISYYVCSQGASIEDVVQGNIDINVDDVNRFIEDGEFCEFIQVHPSMDFDDVVYGLKIIPQQALNLVYAEKRIMTLCNRAKESDNKFCIIFDDINRANVGNLLGNLLYAMEYRNQDVKLPNGETMSVPENVLLIFTENTLDFSNCLDLTFRRRMNFLEELNSNRDVLQRYYHEILNPAAMHLVLDTYDRIKDFILSNFVTESGMHPQQYIPGHGMFFVENNGGNVHLILNNFKLKIKHQVVPYLLCLYSAGRIKTDPHLFIEHVLGSLNVGIEGLNNISGIRKELIRTGTSIDDFSLDDSKAYFINDILANNCSDYRGMLECIIDATITNGILPLDVLLDSILLNTSVAYIESLHAPIERAAFIVDKHKAGKFQYETIRNNSISGTHAYYSLDGAVTGRWAMYQDTEEYVVTYNDGHPEKEYIPLSGFRNHGFNPEEHRISVVHNTANIMTTIHLLLEKYYNVYSTNVELIMESDPDYFELSKLINLERRYLQFMKASMKGRGRDANAPRGDSERLLYYGKKISNLRLLWSSTDTELIVDKLKFEGLISGEIPFSIDSYESLFLPTGNDIKTIIVKGVPKMIDLKNYQAIMDSMGIRQLIFQGPPGTSKTYESKKFVLSQLAPNLPNAAFESQESISRNLEMYKLTDEDYADPLNSSKLTSGGWDLVQFHPSYGYEDFIRGIEVKIPENQTTPSYESVNRILGKISDISNLASANATGGVPKFYLIVDEINRANLATVFGELIYGLEYRNSKVSTPYEVKDSVTGNRTNDIVLGKNLYLIGTMNTADKSIDSIDYAIRRRFIFVDSPADRNVVLNCYQKVSGHNDESSIELLLYDAVQNLFENERFFNSEYQKNDVKIGHTYFLRVQNRGYEDLIIERFVFQVIPILREYVKDGILEVNEDLRSLEHSAVEIHNAQQDEIINMLSENIMLYVKEFGSLNRMNTTIDNNYIGTFIDNLRQQFGY